ncbi:DeoR family transcriptional regulator [Paenibacillus baekrokdamisoli]|uniref:DeoR family transcriptional regulator n=1 Tax=Paenibacillus baekrokdamisoli TaxID=1712516 RepID=A0A3G9JMS0_9BACL|nr:DeoR/GlpR family DNA-binding transcription regulator [Paenibacillus baekrokdamisoli]MBB3071854.1 DeoR family fructose operon transcriptional repressor [Paenibacillus baekrokdamisoli]BBH24164.1 DeoR family transcriptional regulator [Paenibacillus baekrokdamisoli]
MLFEEERKRQIAEYVHQQGRASVQELANNFQVSESTVRRDLKDLEVQELLQRTHGGAVAVMQNDNIEPSFLEKEDRFQQQKLAIARTALSFIREGDTIMLDSGTTTYHLAKLLKNFQRLTVVTNSVMVAQELANEKNIELLLTGGTLRPETLAMVGPFAERAIESVHVDKLFLATNGFDSEAGLTTPNLIEAATKKRMIRSADQVFLLADHSKFGKISFSRFGDPEDVTTLITDSLASPAILQVFEEIGIVVALADHGGVIQ